MYIEFFLMFILDTFGIQGEYVIHCLRQCVIRFPLMQINSQITNSSYFY